MTYRKCENCKALLARPDGYRCMHPLVQAAMARKGVKWLDPEKMDQECPCFTRNVHAKVGREPEVEDPAQLALL